MPWDTTELRELTDEASPFATAPRGSTPPETEEDVGGGDAFTMRESPFSAYTPDGNAETEEEDESADRLPGYAIEETLRPVNEEEGEDESFEGVSSASYESEAAFAPAYEGLFESPFAETESAITSVAETEAAYEQEEAEEEFETPSGADLRRRIVDTALAELGVWEHGARHELEDRMHPTLKAYWETLLSPKKADAYIKAGHAWSAAFISTVMKRAGAGDAFVAAFFHTGYVASAKEAKDAGNATKFWAYDARTTSPELGDVVVRSRTSDTSPVCIVSYGNVTRNRSASSHGDIVVAVRPDSIDVVGGNVGGPRPKKSDTVAQKTLKLDANGFVRQPASCGYFAIVKPPGPSVASPLAPVAPASTPGSGVIDAITSLPGRVAAAVRTGMITMQAGAAIARGERDEGTLTNLVFYTRHPELPSGYKIQAHEKQLVQEWLQLRDQVIRPLLRTLATAHASVPATPSSSPGIAATSSGVNAKTVARIDSHKSAIESAAATSGVPANVLRGIIAAESAGNERTGEGGTGYKGLMQSSKDSSNLTAAVSLREGAKKFVLFTQSMRKFFRLTLKQDFDTLPEDTRLRIVMAGYNAGPGTVKRAMRFARAAGDVSRWGEAEHYTRALISLGTYNPVPSVLEWGVRKGQLTPDAMAADLARLSGAGAAEIQRAYQAGGKWSVKGLATALRPHLFREKTQMKNDGSVTITEAHTRASRSLLCAAAFKQSHTGGYLDTIARYKRFYDAR